MTSAITSSTSVITSSIRKSIVLVFVFVLRNVIRNPESVTVLIRLRHVKSIIGYRHTVGSSRHACFNVIVLIYLGNDDQVSLHYVTIDLPEHAWTCCLSNQSKRLKTMSTFYWYFKQQIYKWSHRSFRVYWRRWWCFLACAFRRRCCCSAFRCCRRYFIFWFYIAC